MAEDGYDKLVYHFKKRLDDHEEMELEAIEEESDIDILNDTDDGQTKVRGGRERVVNQTVQVTNGLVDLLNDGFDFRHRHCVTLLLLDGVG